MSSLEGVELSTGKLSLTLPLAAVSGPNGFGAELTASYRSDGVLDQVTTWNEERYTGLLGLGWSLEMPFISRVGMGTPNDQFLYRGQRLILTGQTKDSPTGVILSFVTENHSLLRIQYFTNDERWEVQGGDGETAIFGGGVMNANELAQSSGFDLKDQKLLNDIPKDWRHGVVYAIRWQRQAALPMESYWVGESVKTVGQQNYPLMWYLTRRVSLYNQSIAYAYEYDLERVGLTGTGQFYTKAIRLKSITVADGGKIELTYEKRPASTATQQSGIMPPAQSYPHSRATDTGNAYQDRIDPHFLRQIQVFERVASGVPTLTATRMFYYGWLNAKTDFEKQIWLGFDDLNSDGIPYQPGQRFTYWGQDQQNDGLVQLTPSGPILTWQQRQAKVYDSATGALFGMLKSATTPDGATTSYSYGRTPDDCPDAPNWNNHRELTGITAPDANWEKPAQFWGGDGFMVLRWFHKKDNKIKLVIYDWLGYWQLVKVWYSELIFDVVTNEDAAAVIVPTGSMFALIRPGTNSPISIFRRAPFQPGVWEEDENFPLGVELKYGITKAIVSFFKPYSTFFIADVGDQVVACLDLVLGNKLYVFGWTGTKWDIMPPISMPAADTPKGKYSRSHAMIVKDNVILVAWVIKSTLNLSLSRYNPLAAVRGEGTSWPAAVTQSIQLAAPPESGPDMDLKGLDLFETQGSLVAHVVIKYSHWYPKFGPKDVHYIQVVDLNPDGSMMACSVLHAQPLAGNSASTQIRDGFFIGGDDTLHVLGGDDINVTASGSLTEGTEAFKSVFRFVAGGQTTNPGWFNQLFWNSKQDEVAWAHTDIAGTTIAVDQTGLAEEYTFWQFDPVRQMWMPQQAVRISKTTDWLTPLQAVASAVQFLTIVVFSLPGVGEITMPVTAAAAGIASYLGGRFIVFAVGVVGFLEGTAQSVGLATLEGWVLNSIYSGRQSGTALGVGYFIVGHKGLPPSREVSPRAYFRTFENNWLEVSGSVIPIPTLGHLTPVQSKLQALVTATTGLAEDTYFFGANFGLFSYVVSRQAANSQGITLIHEDQVVLFSNGAAKLLPMPADPQSKAPPGYGDFKAPFMLARGDRPYPPAAPWGGILGYVPKWNFSKHNPKYTYSQPEGVAEAERLGLFYLYDRAVSGPIQDYVVKKVAVEDGLQTVTHHIQYTAKFASFSTDGQTGCYNLVSVASGSDVSFDAAQKMNGRTEYYFYPGGVNYPGSVLMSGNLPQTPTLYLNGQAQTYYDLMQGLLYATRAYTANNDLVASQDTCWGVYEVAVPNSGRKAVGVRVGKEVQTLDGASSESVSTYDLGSGNGMTGRNTALLRSSAVAITNSDGQRETTATSYTYFFEIEEYRDLAQSFYLLTPVVQTTVNKVFAANTGAPPATAPGTYTLSSQVATWTQIPPPQRKNVIELPFGIPFPFSLYNWRGLASNGQAVGTLNSFPWAQEGQSATWINAWALANRVTATRDGIVLAAESSVGLRSDGGIDGLQTITRYDRSMTLPIAQFTLPNRYVGSQVYYTGFEPYEDLGPDSGWDTSVQSRKNVIETDSNTGDCCLSIGANSSVTWSTKLPNEPGAATVLPRVLISLYYKTPALDPSNTSGLGLTLEVKWLPAKDGQAPLALPLPPTGNTWQRTAQVLIPAAELKATGAVIQFKAASVTVLLDDFLVMPVDAASVQVSVFDPVSKLLTATMDANGLTVRNLYDFRKRPLARIVGKGDLCTVRELHAEDYSRDWSAVANPEKDAKWFASAAAFDPALPNSVLSIQAQGGGRSFRFPLNENGGWTLAGATSFVNRRLLLASGATASYPIPTKRAFGFGFRAVVQMVAPAGTPLKTVQKNGLFQIKFGPVWACWNSAVTDGKPFYQLTDPSGVAMGTTSPQGGIVIVPSDGPPPPRGTIAVPFNGVFYSPLWADLLVFTVKDMLYFYVNGRLISAVPVATVSGQIVLTVPNGSATAFLIQEMLVFVDPQVSAQFLDGERKLRQTQSLVEAAELAAPPSTNPPA